MEFSELLHSTFPSLAIFLYSFRAIAHGWTLSLVPHPWRKNVSTRSHVLSKSWLILKSTCNRFLWTNEVFFLNRVKTESSDSSEKELHKNVSENWLKNLWSFHSLVLDLYPNGLWGSSSNNAANAKTSQEVANEQLPSANGKPAICKLDGKKWILENLGETTKEIDIKAEQVFLHKCSGTSRGLL